MHATPFANIQYHQDGRHIFTVDVGEQRKQFVTLEGKILPQQALLNALKWRNSQVGTDYPNHQRIREELLMDDYIAQILAPSATETVKVAVPGKKRAMLVPEGVKVQVIPTGQPGKIFEPAFNGKVNKDDLAEGQRKAREGRIKSLMAIRNRNYPSLPSNVSPRWTKPSDGKNKQETLIIFVSVMVGGTRRNKPFYVGTRESFTLARYRAMRHAAICLRNEAIRCQAIGEELDLAPFNDVLTAMRNDQFPWPFKGTLPSLEQRTPAQRVKAMRQSEQELLDGRKKLQREGRSRRYPSLPRGVAPVVQHSAGNGKGRSPQCHIVVTGPIEGKQRQRSFYVCMMTSFSLKKYRVARHVAMCWRKECLDAQDENRPIDVEAFKDWKVKIVEGTFKWPFKGTVPTDLNARKTTMLDARKLGKIEARKAGRAILGLLKQHPALGSAMSVLDFDDRELLIDDIAALIQKHGYL